MKKLWCLIGVAILALAPWRCRDGRADGDAPLCPHERAEQHRRAAGGQLAKAIEEKTKGAVKVNVFPSSQLGTLQEQAEAVSSGSVQLHHNTMAGSVRCTSPSALDTPFMYKDVQHLMRVADPTRRS